MNRANRTHRNLANYQQTASEIGRLFQELLAAAEALLEEQDQVSESISHYQRLVECKRRLRRAVRQARPNK